MSSVVDVLSRDACTQQPAAAREVVLRGINRWRVVTGKIVERWGRLDDLGRMRSSAGRRGRRAELSCGSLGGVDDDSPRLFRDT